LVALSAPESRHAWSFLRDGSQRAQTRIRVVSPLRTCQRVSLTGHVSDVCLPTLKPRRVAMCRFTASVRAPDDEQTAGERHLGEVGTAAREREAAMKRALLVGVDEYVNFPPLHGAVNDVEALAPLVSRNDDGSPNFHCRRRTTAAGGVPRDQLLDDLDVLLGGGADLALFYFAGHGTGSGTDVTLVTQDGTRATPGVAFSQVLTKVAESSVREVILILDCCFSGGAGGIPQLGVSGSALRDGVTVLAASRSDQPSAEADGRGRFSSYLEGALLGGAADVLGRVTVAGLYSYLDESFGAWGQRPVFKANVDRLHDLRVCAAAVPLPDLRRIAEFFSSPDAVLALDPSYEPTAEPRDEAHELVFGILQRYRAAGLLEPIDAEHMYDAATRSTGCRLTALGRRYRHMAADAMF
jgi:hypothetical protein